MYIVLLIILAVAFILYIRYDYQPKEKPQPMHFDIITEEDDAEMQNLQYFCIKDKGYHVSVWPKDQRLGDYLDFTIAGMNYVDNISDYIGEFTGTLIADPSNPYDHNAIKVVARDGHRVGYVPKNTTAQVRSFTTLPCQCYCFIGFNNGTYFSCCYITNLPNVSPYKQ